MNRRDFLKGVVSLCALPVSTLVNLPVANGEEHKTARQMADCILYGNTRTSAFKLPVALRQQYKSSLIVAYVEHKTYGYAIPQNLKASRIQMLKDSAEMAALQQARVLVPEVKERELIMMLRREWSSRSSDPLMSSEPANYTIITARFNFIWVPPGCIMRGSNFDTNSKLRALDV